MITTVTITTIETILSDLPMVLEIGQMVIFALIIFLIAKEFLLILPKSRNFTCSKNPYFLGQVINIYIVSLFFIFLSIVVYNIFQILK